MYRMRSISLIVDSAHNRSHARKGRHPGDRPQPDERANLNGRLSANSLIGEIRRRE